MKRYLILSAGFLVFVLFTGCNGSVEAFSATLRSGGEETGVELRDLERRPVDQEARLGGQHAAAARFELRDITGPAMPPQDAALQAVELTLTGVDGGAAVTLDRQDQTLLRTRIDDLFPIGRPQTVRVRLSAVEPIPVAELAGSRLTMAVAGEDAQYAVDRVVFSAEDAPPRVAFLGADGGAYRDDRLQVRENAQGVVVAGLESMIAAGAGALVVEYRAAEELFSRRNDRPAMLVELRDDSGGSEDLQLMLRPGQNRVVLRPALWGSRPTEIALSGIREGVELLELRPLDPPPRNSRVPIPTELAELLVYPQDTWRTEDYELFSWSLYPDILIVDSRNYQVQAHFFRRLAFFVEKRGFQGTLLSDDDLANRHGWNAHNYNPEGLAAFYNAVAETSFPINGFEQELREIALENGLLLQNEDGSYVPGDGGVLAVSQASYAELRRLLVVHEAMHGVFYEEPGFRNRVFQYWDTALTPREQGFWRDFFSWMSYSPDDRYLVVNEFQGYLLQQREAAVRWYFRTRVSQKLQNAYPSRRDGFQLFLADHPSTFVDAAAAINQALYEESGMVGGDPFCLLPLSAEG